MDEDADDSKSKFRFCWEPRRLTTEIAGMLFARINFSEAGPSEGHGPNTRRVQ